MISGFILAGCQFGPDADCVYPCHCMNATVCDSTTGDCPTGCDDGDPNGYMWRGAWGGPGCQVGKCQQLLHVERGLMWAKWVSVSNG